MYPIVNRENCKITSKEIIRLNPKTVIDVDSKLIKVYDENLTITCLGNDWTIFAEDSCTINVGSNSTVRAMNFSNITTDSGCYIFVGCECRVTCGQFCDINSGVELYVTPGSHTTATHFGGLTIVRPDNFVSIMRRDGDTDIDVQKLTSKGILTDTYSKMDGEFFNPIYKELHKVSIGYTDYNVTDKQLAAIMTILGK